MLYRACYYGWSEGRRVKVKGPYHPNKAYAESFKNTHIFLNCWIETLGFSSGADDLTNEVSLSDSDRGLDDLLKGLVL